jgi:hypothetical protein
VVCCGKADGPREFEPVYGRLTPELGRLVRIMAEADRRSIAQMVTILIEEAVVARQAKEARG